MENHVIICGYGKMGSYISDMLLSYNIKHIVIENDPNKEPVMKDKGLSYIIDDATKSTVLKKAEIDKASAIVIVTGDNAKNLFIIITARSISKDIYILSKATDSFTKEKFIEAGANYIVTPELSAADEILKELKLK
ncbi:MAG: calcium-gated potassium channel MthK [Candidatus Micrarchaeota archaeon]|nr:MAG: calcium-gated potassium channel MthK [Candidatus Micrarchaeota archaeon]